jgi:hypothetical protein
MKEYFLIHFHIATFDYGLEYMGSLPQAQTGEMIKA